MDFSQLLSNFAVEGQFRACTPIDGGHIHATYRVDIRTADGLKAYVLQKIKTEIFDNPTRLMLNIARVTTHIRNRLVEQRVHDIDRRVLQVVPTREKSHVYITATGGSWRLFHFVTNAHPAGEIAFLADVYEAAYAFGQFIALVADLPQQELVETIPHFHDGPRRYRALCEAIERDVHGRAVRAREAINYIAARSSRLSEPQRLVDQGRLLLRVTHNDTKSNNVLIDNTSRKALCVIDLDTVMPGLALYDFGDLVRTTVSEAPEDEPDINKIKVQLPRLEQATKGFIDGARGHLSSEERNSLSLGPTYMALIMAVRFLTDYLQGDGYYRICHPHHNLQRCNAQLKLMQLLENSHGQMAAWLTR